MATQQVQDGTSARNALRDATAALLALTFDLQDVNSISTNGDFDAFKAAFNTEKSNLEAMRSALADLDAIVGDLPDNAAASASLDAAAAQEAADSSLLASKPIKLTSSGANEHPRMAVDRNGDIWLAWQSTKGGVSEIMASKYFGQCGIWNMPGQGGSELRITNFGVDGKRAAFPGVAIGANGEAHVVFQGTSEDGNWEVFYSHSTGGGASFVKPIRLTRSSGNSMMPDVAVTKDLGGNEKVVVVWHDDRFGDHEIMAAEHLSGQWRSSGQGGTDIRITQAEGDSLFPRIAADAQGNLRVVYHDNRRDSNAVYMSTFVTLSNKWDSSAQGGSDRLISNSPADALYPDVSIDHTGGTSVAWHDFRNMLDNPDQHEEIYALYCPRLGHPGGVHFPPLQPNIEARLDVDFDIVDCVGFNPIDFTNAPEVCLKVRAPGATFWRAANEDGAFSEWQQFRPNVDLDTMTVPWTLNCTGGGKRVCVQVQDAQMVGFPLCREVTLAIQPAGFKIEFFSDEDMTNPLPTFRGRPVAASGDMFVKFTASVPQLLPPLFDVISRGEHVIFNQETLPLDVSGFSGFSGSSGIGSFVGNNTSSASSLAFSASSAKVFKARFNVKRDDGILHVDGPARILVHGKSICDVLPSTKEPEPPVETLIVGPGSGVPPAQNDPPTGTGATTTPHTFVLTLGEATANVWDQFSFGEHFTPGGTDGVFVAGTTQQMYAVGQTFQLFLRANLVSIKARLIHEGNNPGEMAGHSLTIDLVPMQSLQGHAIFPGPYVPVQTAILDASSLPLGPGNILTPSTTIAGFSGSPAEPGYYAIVFRETKERPVFDHPWAFEVAGSSHQADSVKNTYSLRWHISERVKFPPAGSSSLLLAGADVTHTLYVEMTFATA